MQKSHSLFYIMKILLLLPLYLFISLSGSSQAPVKYTTILELAPGETVEKFLSCWWPVDNNEPASLVIRQPNGKLSLIERGKRRYDLIQDQIPARAECDRLDPYKIPRDSHMKFSELKANGQWHIRSAKRDYGSYDKIVFMKETEQRFVAVVSARTNNIDEYYYLDASGKKDKLDGKPQNFYTNSGLTKAAIMLFPKTALPAEAINKLPREQQVALFEQMNKSSDKKQVWTSDGKTYSVDKKSKLFFDASGRHFIEAPPANTFYIDGEANNKNISGGGTLVFVNAPGNKWAYFYGIYLTFQDNTTIKEAISPYLTGEGGKEYLNWYKIEQEGSKVVLKRGQREL